MGGFWRIYLTCALGVFMSVILPVIRQWIIKPKPELAMEGATSSLAPIWKATRPYFATGLFSLIVALLLIAFLQDQLTDWRAALLAGYAFDSTLQKLRNPD